MSKTIEQLFKGLTKEEIEKEFNKQTYTFTTKANRCMKCKATNCETCNGESEYEKT